MKFPSGTINVAASTRRLEVDNRFSLKYYYRIADNLLRQADIFREEKNKIDLYIMLLRFSSLVSETIPCHRDYQILLKGERLYFKRKLLNAMTELEVLKPSVQTLIEELNRKHTKRVDRSHQVHQSLPVESSLEWPPVKSQIGANREIRQVQQPFGRDSRSQSSWVLQDKFSDSPAITLSIPRPREETLLRHSILGPGGLHGRWQPSTIGTRVNYPSNIDSTPAEIPSLIQLAEDVPIPAKEDRPIPAKDGVDLHSERSRLESVLSLDDGRWSVAADGPCPVTASDTIEALNQIAIIRQPSPPPVLADVQDLVPVNSSQVIDVRSESAKDLQDEFIRSESPLQLHISTGLMDSFMKMAKSNTDRNLETCGVLAGSLKNRKFFITALIIPKQESTENTCQTMNEEEIFDVQDERSLFPLGWIHTHPTQSCFMSSVDVHTHYSYQIMLPEAIAIVMAPTDSKRKHGIFRLTTPGGMSVIRQCQQRGFHHHNGPPEGGPIYDTCTDVYMNPSLKFDIIDLR